MLNWLAGFVITAPMLLFPGMEDSTPSPPLRLGRLERLTNDRLEKRRPMWSRDGKFLAFGRQEADGTHLWQYVWEVKGEPSPRRLLAGYDPPSFDAAFAPDGASLLFTKVRFIGTQGNLDITSARRDGSALRVITEDQQDKVIHQEWPAWSPDGTRFAFSSTHEGNQEIYTAGLDGKTIVRMTQHPGHDAHPCWSPDGKWILFATDRWGNGLELAKIGIDGAGLTRLSQSPGLDDYPSVSPDGRHIAFVSNRDGQLEVYVAEADGSHPVNVSNHPRLDGFPTWTPDGQGITYVSHRDGGCDLYIQRMEFAR